MKNNLYPKIKPYRSGFLKVSDLHNMYWECSGNSKGIPVLVVHGGPGGASKPLYRRYFNPNRFNIIQFDQRGCGKSLPNAELEDNSTKELVSDMEFLRNYLGISQWHLFGGSWGSTLSLIYSIKNHEKVLSLILRGVFLCRSSELSWFYQYGASQIFPEEFNAYSSLIPEHERDNLIKAFYKRLISKDPSVRLEAAKAWTRWEMSTSKLITDKNYLLISDNENYAIAFARIEAHYFVNNIFMEENYILKNIGNIRHLPVAIIQGRYDVVCPVKSAWDLHKLLPNSSLEIICDAGHSADEVGITRALVAETDCI